MKIKNEFVKIKTDKEIVLHNYIYDEYLEIFLKSQYDDNYINSEKMLTTCFIKFENRLDNFRNADINDFDVSMRYATGDVIGNDSRVLTDYTYNGDNGIKKISTSETIQNLNAYAGKKITALGFGTTSKIYACVDTSNYTIYVVQNENFTVSRRDIISSDAIYSGTNYPKHLSPIKKWVTYTTAGNMVLQSQEFAKLYSIGLGTIKGQMSEEYVLGEDIEIIEESNTSYGFNLRKGNMQSVFPNNSLYCANNLYPMPLYRESELLPHENLYCANNLYPLASNYKYIIYRFKMFYKNRGDQIIATGEEYTMNLPNTTKGLFEILTKMERS